MLFFCSWNLYIYSQQIYQIEGPYTRLPYNNKTCAFNIFYATEIQDRVVLSVILDILTTMVKENEGMLTLLSEYYSFWYFTYAFLLCVIFWPWPPLELTVVGGISVSQTHLVSHMFNTGLKKNCQCVFATSFPDNTHPLGRSWHFVGLTLKNDWFYVIRADVIANGWFDVGPTPLAKQALHMPM